MSLVWGHLVVQAFRSATDGIESANGRQGVAGGPALPLGGGGIYFAKRGSGLPGNSARATNNGAIPMEKPRLDEKERLAIELGLKAGKTPYAIAKELGRPTKTVVREIRARAAESDKGAFGRVTNRCVHRMECDARHLCVHCSYDGNRRCSLCRLCNRNCSRFVEDRCPKLDMSPWVCNGCKDEPRCVLRKRFYQHDAAQRDYRRTLVESRTGANVSEEELLAFDRTLADLTAKGQSIHAAMTNNPGLFSMSEKTVYRYVAGGLLSVRNGDLPRKMALKPRKGKPVEHKVDTLCRVGRSYADYQRFIAEHPGSPVTEMDTVEGVKGGKVLLTMHFMPYDFMVAFLLGGKTSAAVSDTFADIRLRLRKSLGDAEGDVMFMRLFPVVLTDNGSEFSDPSRIENDGDGRPMTSVFYCDPCASWQKALVERNHELLRLVLPKATAYTKATSFDNLSQAQVDTLLSHVNGYVRKSIGNRTPYDLFADEFGGDVAGIFGIRRVEPNDITLKPSLLGLTVELKPGL